jgi:uncharacterized protein YkwD
LLFASIFLLAGFYVSLKQGEDQHLVGQEKSSPKIDQSLELENETESEIEAEVPGDSLGALIGKDTKVLVSTLGEPDRKDPSAYGYTWLIYSKDQQQYIQAGVLDGKVVTLYAAGTDSNIAPFKIDQHVEKIFIHYPIQPEVTLKLGSNSYKFELSENDINTRPLIKVGENYAQLYIDRYTGRLSSVRFLDKKTLLKHQPYEMVYNGNLIQSEPPTDEESLQIEAGIEKQILDITNAIRQRHGVNGLNWHQKAARAAYNHSKDMQENEYFSHESDRHGSLEDRLEKAEVDYSLAGENIAFNYIDGPDVVEGWLNSKNHREALLNVEFTHLGVGVYQQYYTQNFVKLNKE